ncbi:hypothetical protein F5887DRAFT_1077544 [Amanita rubescens]|nr:hypothetical protein F5887DRAFT_1077544 [Amanita rubescens]
MAKLNPSAIIVIVQLALVMDPVVGLPVGTSSISERDIIELEPRVPPVLSGFGSKALGYARQTAAKHAGKKDAAISYAKKGGMLAHGYIQKNGGYGKFAGGLYNAVSNKRDLESISALEARDAPYIYLAERDGSGSPGKRDLEGRSWNRLDARGYESMNELD